MATPREASAFSSRVLVRYHAHDRAALSRRCAETGETPQDLIRRVLRQEMHDAGAWPYGTLHTIFLPHPEISIEMQSGSEDGCEFRLHYEPGDVGVGILPRWTARYIGSVYGDPTSHVIAAMEAEAAEQFERELSNGEYVEVVG